MHFQKLRLFFYFITANKTRDPIDRMAKSANSARAVGSQLVRGHMLSHFDCFVKGVWGPAPMITVVLDLSLRPCP